MENLSLIIMLEIVSISLLGIFLLYLIKIQFSLKNEFRIAEYAITPKEKENLPWFEQQQNKIIKIIKIISKILRKSTVLTKYSNNYKKYVSYKEKNLKSIDYISIKFLVGLLLIIFYIINALIQYKIEGIFILITFLIGFFAPDIYLTIMYKHKHRELEENLLESVIIMNNAFKSGKNILEAIEIVKNELNGPLKEEYQKVYIDLTYGLDIDVVFNRFYERVKLDDIKYISSSLTLLNQTGGNIVKVFSSIENNFYDKKVLNEELEALTSSSKLMYKMLLSIPILLVIILFSLNPVYFYPMIQSKVGIILIILSLILYIAYAVIVKKVTKVKL